MIYRNGTDTVEIILPKKEEENPYKFVWIKKGKPKKIWRPAKPKKKAKIEQRKNWKYTDYMLSRAWRQRKREYFEKYGKQCAACGTTQDITVHHTSYRHLGREQDNELVVLCWPCHEAFHNEYGTGLDRIEETTRFIADIQESRELRELTKYF